MSWKRTPCSLMYQTKLNQRRIHWCSFQIVQKETSDTIEYLRFMGDGVARNYDIHALGHFRAESMTQMLQWKGIPNIKEKFLKFFKKCHICQKRSKSKPHFAVNILHISIDLLRRFLPWVWFTHNIELPINDQFFNTSFKCVKSN